jgi:hypothetical protein
MMKTTRKPQRANPLGSYLAITAGVGAVTLINAQGVVVYYNGPALTVDIDDTDRWLYFSPLATPGNPTLGVRAGIDDGADTGDRFQVLYRSVNYVYTVKDEGLLRMDWGASGDVLLKLDEGQVINAGSNTWFGNTFAYMNTPDWTTANSPWATGQDGTTGFVPFRFALATALDDYYYGWADYTYNNDALTQSLTLNNFAYNDIPNADITTEVVPEPSTLLLLAMGGASVALARLRRKAKRTPETVA